MPVGTIVGGAIGGTLGIVVIAALAWYKVTKLKLDREASVIPVEVPISPEVENGHGGYGFGGQGLERRAYSVETPGSPRLVYPDEVVSANLAERTN